MTYPRVTTAEMIPLPIDPPSGSNDITTFGISFCPEPVEFLVNGQKVLLRKNEPVKLGNGLVRVESNGETISCTEPNDPCVLCLSYLKDANGKIYWINSRFY